MLLNLPTRAMLFIGICMLFTSTTCLAQQKAEKEFRISFQEVPEQARLFIREHLSAKKVKWYREIGLNRNSYEAKTTWKGRKFSIEFDDDGTLEDIEITVKWKKIDANLQDKINATISGNSEKHRIKKVQYQYDNPDGLLTKLSTVEHLVQYNPKVELIVNTKEGKVYKTYEFLFDLEGKLLSKREIIERNSYNIEY